MRNVFVSFRQSDGKHYKEDLCSRFDKNSYIVDYSEDRDLSMYSDAMIQKELYAKIKKSSVTIILLTPGAINYKRNAHNEIEDWIYKEVNYSLEDRENNKTNGLIAVYVKEAEPYLFKTNYHKCEKCDGYEYLEIFDKENLFRKNILNRKAAFKNNQCDGIFDLTYDSYCSFISYEEFIKNITKHIEIAEEKRNNLNEFEITKELQ